MKLNANDKKALAASLAAVAFPTATFFLFGPISLYIANLTELWFSVTDIVWPGMIVFVLSAGILTGVGMILRHKKKAFCAYISVLFGLGLALYIQGNFIPNNYGLLNGKTVDWASYSHIALLDGAMWLGCLVLPFLLWRFTRKQYVTIIQFAAAAFLGVQLLALGVTCLTTDFSQSGVSDSYLSNEGLYEVSDEENVIIFVLDTFDQRFFKEVYEAEPEYMDFLDGFTYYSNATGLYPSTGAALPYLMTGQFYENKQPFSTFINEAWEASSDYYDTLAKNKYEIGIYTTLELAVSNKAHGTWIYNATKERTKVTSYFDLETAMARLVAMTYFPDGLKKTIWAYDNVFEELKAPSDSGEEPYDWDDAAFYKGLKNDKLSITEGKKYKFIHLEGTHAPFTLKQDVTYVKGNKRTEASEEAKACLTILQEYVRQLKELGVYDNTCLIVTGDHGYSEFQKSNPILMIKGIGETHELAFDDSPVSHVNIRPTILQQIGVEDRQRYGEALDEVSKTAYRRYLQYKLDGSTTGTYFPDMLEYEVLPGGNEPEDYILTGNTYTSKGVVQSQPYFCEPGVPIKFDDTESLSYFIFGTLPYLSGKSRDYLAASGHSSRACFNIGETQGDLICHIDLGHIQDGTQQVIISSNSGALFDGKVNNNHPGINFVVPSENIQDGLLYLDFEYPDARTPEGYGLSEGETLQSIGFRSIVFEKAENTRSIDFSASGDASDYMVTGWWGGDENYTWTEESASVLLVSPSEEKQRLVITYVTYPGANDTAVYCDGEYIGTLPHHDALAYEILELPACEQPHTDARVLTFTTDGATSSMEYYGGDSTDDRILGLAVSEIGVLPASVLGEPVVYDSNLSTVYFDSGVTDTTREGYLWSLGGSSRASFPVGDIKADLTCHIELLDWVPGDAQRVSVSSAGEELYSGTVTANMPYMDFAVPARLIQDGTVTLDFAYPDACSPKSLGLSDDERVLAVAFKSMVFTAQEG